MSCFYSLTLPIISSFISPPHISAVLSPGYKIVCYYGAWAIYRPEPMSFRPRDVQAKGCTHLIYSFAGLDNSTLEIVSLDPKFDIEKGEQLREMKSTYPTFN